MVKLELGKRDLVWMGLIVVLLGIGFAYGFGGNDPAVMGHSADEIEVDDILCNKITGTDCRDVANNTVLECVTVTCSTGWACAAKCPSGYTMTGGGGSPNNNGNLVVSRPSGEDGWLCGVYLGGICYARCCK